MDTPIVPTLGSRLNPRTRFEAMLGRNASRPERLPEPQRWPRLNYSHSIDLIVGEATNPRRSDYFVEK